VTQRWWCNNCGGGHAALSGRRLQGAITALNSLQTNAKVGALPAALGPMACALECSCSRQPWACRTMPRTAPCVARCVRAFRAHVCVCDMCVCVLTCSARLRLYQELAEQKRTGGRDKETFIPAVRGYAKRLGISQDDLTQLRAIHVAGSKVNVNLSRSSARPMPPLLLASMCSASEHVRRLQPRTWHVQPRSASALGKLEGRRGMEGQGWEGAVARCAVYTEPSNSMLLALPPSLSLSLSLSCVCVCVCVSLSLLSLVSLSLSLSLSLVGVFGWRLPRCASLGQRVNECYLRVHHAGGWSQNGPLHVRRPRLRRGITCNHPETLPGGVRPSHPLRGNVCGLGALLCPSPLLGPHT